MNFTVSPLPEIHLTTHFEELDGNTPIIKVLTRKTISCSKNCLDFIFRSNLKWNNHRMEEGQLNFTVSPLCETEPTTHLENRMVTLQILKFWPEKSMGAQKIDWFLSFVQIWNGIIIEWRRGNWISLCLLCVRLNQQSILRIGRWHFKLLKFWPEKSLGAQNSNWIFIFHSNLKWNNHLQVFKLNKE